MSQPTPQNIDGVVRTLRIIVFAQIVGVLLFTGFVFFMLAPGEDAAPGADAADNALPLMTVMAMGFLFMAATARFVLIPVLTVAQRRQFAARAENLSPDERKTALLPMYQTLTIISVAILEGAAFFAAIAYMLEGHPLTLVCVLILVTGILLHFPSRGRVESWVDGQLRRAEEDQMLQQSR